MSAANARELGMVPRSEDYAFQGYLDQEPVTQDEVDAVCMAVHAPIGGGQGRAGSELFFTCVWLLGQFAWFFGALGFVFLLIALLDFIVGWFA